MLCLVIRDWSRYFHRCFDNLKSGRWLEEQELQVSVFSNDGFAKSDFAFFRWPDFSMQAAKMRGIDGRASNNFAWHLKGQGFINLTERVYEWPLDKWPEAQKTKDIGKATLTNLIKGLEGLRMLVLAKYLGWTR